MRNVNTVNKTFSCYFILTAMLAFSKNVCRPPVHTSCRWRRLRQQRRRCRILLLLCPL